MRRQLLGPMERIIKILESMTTQDPLGSLKESLKEAQAQGSEAGKQSSTLAEPVFAVEKAILRLVKLLQLGLGEAGSKIIASNMNEGQMITNKEGEIVHAIFGFCDIRNFTDCTEVLREDAYILSSKRISLKLTNST